MQENTPTRIKVLEIMQIALSGHRWSGWPGAWCLDCGLEDADELDLAGHWSEVGHRYSGKPHTSQPCAGCSNGPCAMPGARLFDPYLLRR